jgi:hypothetical protein
VSAVSSATRVTVVAILPAFIATMVLNTPTLRVSLLSF